MTGPSWLVVQRHGCRWAIPGTAVQTVETTAEALVVAVVGGRLRAEKALGLASGLCVRAAGPVALSVLPRGSWGLALGADGPAIVIDPIDPPRELRAEEELSE